MATHPILQHVVLEALCHHVVTDHPILQHVLLEASCHHVVTDQKLTQALPSVLYRGLIGLLWVALGAL